MQLSLQETLKDSYLNPMLDVKLSNLEFLSLPTFFKLSKMELYKVLFAQSKGLQFSERF